ncbi:MAG TPA: hypothetical protein VFP10_07885 [Candidatus Eisenbacteria bacterium]|nr:hypothetical protein [Candidatus Eisenbacteria bacterium]
MHSNDALPPPASGDAAPYYQPPEPETAHAEGPLFEPPPREAQPTVAVLPSGNSPGELAAVKQLGWNWGGFFLPYFWLIGHGRLSVGILLALSALVPFLSFIHLLLYPATALYLGYNGYELAWREQPYHSIGQLRERERAWMLWGAALSLVLFIMLFMSLLYLRFLGDQVDQFIEEL